MEQRLAIATGHATLQVADDGVGFEPSLQAADGLGLRGMHERAERLAVRCALKARLALEHAFRLTCRDNSGQRSGRSGGSPVRLLLEWTPQKEVLQHKVVEPSTHRTRRALRSEGK